jgi:hypothetical protein
MAVALKTAGAAALPYKSGSQLAESPKKHRRSCLKLAEQLSTIGNASLGELNWTQRVCLDALRCISSCAGPLLDLWRSRCLVGGLTAATLPEAEIAPTVFVDWRRAFLNIVTVVYAIKTQKKINCFSN